MTKLILNNVSSGYASNALLNTNNTATVAAVENTLSRDGTSPNSMGADFDMNGYNILNQGNPISLTGLNWRGPWLTATLYAIGDVISNGYSSYICIVVHTSGTFATDLVAVKWQIVSSIDVASLKDTSGNFAGLTLFKINFKNALNTFISYFTNANTASRTYTFPDRTGTIADNTDLALKANLSGAIFTGRADLAASTDIASATTIDLTTSATGNTAVVTGTTPTTGFTMTAGQWMLLLPSGAWPITYHATTANINGGTSYTCAAGDRVFVAKDNAGIIRVTVIKQDGTSVIPASVKVGYASRDISIASGTQDITGLGFTPTSIDVQCNVNGGVGKTCWGFSDGTNNMVIWDDHAASANAFNSDFSTNAIYMRQSLGNTVTGSISIISDGFRITWTKTGSPTGTAYINYKAMR